jgi:hypothetical protein
MTEGTNRSTSELDLEEVLLRAARAACARGPGFAQEGVVLHDVVDELGYGGDLESQQDLLTAWHSLFHQGRLSWGYDVDNPGPPFFHIPRNRR